MVKHNKKVNNDNKKMEEVLFFLANFLNITL
jgi:hypothetical protein